jgi:hypothetical protein
LIDEGQGRVRELVVDGLHPLGGERPGVLDALLSHAPEHRVLDRVVFLGGPRMHDAARPEALLEFRVLGVVWVLRLFLGV